MAPVNSDGKTFGLWRQSVSSLSGVFSVVFSVIILGTKHFTFATVVAYVLLTLFTYFPIGTIIIDQLNSPIQHVLIDVIQTPLFWLMLGLTVMLSACSVYIPKLYIDLFHPSLVDILEQDRNKKKQCENFSKILVSETDETPATGKFSFNDSIMMAGWAQSPYVKNDQV